VERKERSVWPLVLGLALLVMIILGLVAMLGNDRDRGGRDTAEVGILRQQQTAPQAPVFPVA
jgi:hypothetical protein